MIKTLFYVLLAVVCAQASAHGCDHCKAEKASKEMQARLSRCTFTVLRGEESADYLTDIGMLRMEVYRDYPYLYDGDMATELAYLSQYPASNDSLVVLVKEGDAVIGAVMGIPLAQTWSECQRPFIEGDLSVEPIYFIGEMVLLTKFEGLRLRGRMWAMFEEAVRGLGAYDKVTVCEVVRDHDDPRRTDDAFDFYQFWEQKGFGLRSELTANFPWREVDSDAAVSHLMVYLVKDLVE